MKSPTIILLAAFAAALFCVSAQTASAATDYTSNVSGGSGRWDVNASWTPSGVPVAGDTAKILAGDTIYVDSTSGAEQVDTLTLEDAASGSDPGIMEFRVSGSLKILLTSGLIMEHDLANYGRIVFTGTDTGTPGNLIISEDMSAAGAIRVEGSDGGTISSDVPGDVLTITETGRVYAPDGALTISASIINHGRITANGKDSGYDINFTVNGPEATSRGLFEVVRCDAVMHFNMDDPITFSGPANWNVEAGTMRFSKDVTTADSALGGGVRVVLGTVQADVDISALFRGVYTGW